MSKSQTTGMATGRMAVAEAAPGGIAELEHALAPVSVGGRDPGYTLRRGLIAGDAIAIAIALAVATLAIEPGSGLSQFGVGLLTIPAWWVIFKLYGLYDRDSKRVNHSTLDDVPWLFHALVIGSLGLWLFVRAVDPEAKLVFAEAVAFVVLAFVAVFAMRTLVRALPLAGAERVLIVGGGPLTALLLRKIRSRHGRELEPVGYLRGSDDLEDFPAGMRFVEQLGDATDLDAACEQSRCDRVLIVSGETDRERLAELIHEVRRRRLPVSLVPSMFDTIGPSVEIDDIEGVTILGVNPPVLNRSSRALKRTIDVIVAGLALVLTAPLMAAAAIGTRLSSPGPAIFRQQRVGRRGKPFTLYKFRTMVDGAAAQSESLMERSEHRAWLLLDEDPRATPFGRLLRRSAIDELPQLWNVLRGEMSLVGPRPMTPEIYEHVSGRDLHRLDLTPGVTGLWQVLGRTAIPFDEMLKLDYLYVTNWSLWQDVRLLLRTLPAVIGGRGAN